jgi:hypothetical protein
MSHAPAGKDSQLIDCRRSGSFLRFWLGIGLLADILDAPHDIVKGLGQPMPIGRHGIERSVIFDSLGH